MGLGKAIKGFLGVGQAGNVIEGTNKLLGSIDNLTTSAEEKANIRSKVILAVVEAQSKAVVAEATSDSYITKSWRPILALSWGTIITYTYFIGPMFSLPVVEVPEAMFNLLSIMITGYAGARSVEKIAGVAVPLFSARQTLKKLKMELKNK